MIGQLEYFESAGPNDVVAGGLLAKAPCGRDIKIDAVPSDAANASVPGRVKFTVPDSGQR